MIILIIFLIATIIGSLLFTQITIYEKGITPDSCPIRYIFNKKEYFISFDDFQEYKIIKYLGEKSLVIKLKNREELSFNSRSLTKEIYDKL